MVHIPSNQFSGRYDDTMIITSDPNETIGCDTESLRKRVPFKKYYIPYAEISFFINEFFICICCDLNEAHLKSLVVTYQRKGLRECFIFFIIFM